MDINKLTLDELKLALNTIHDKNLQTESNPMLWIVYDKDAQLKIFEYFKTNMEKFVEGRVLEENEYLLKIRPDGGTRWRTYNTGFLTKLNKNGTIPVNFAKWNFVSNKLDIFVVTETYRTGWKIVGARFGESQNWAILLHPDNYTVEIYMNSLIDLINTNTIINGEIQGEFKWKEKNLEKKS